MSVSAQFKNASVVSATHRKGILRIVIDAPTDDSNATISDLNEMSGGTFKGLVTIKGKAAQLALELDRDKPRPTGEKD